MRALTLIFSIVLLFFSSIATAEEIDAVESRLRGQPAQAAQALLELSRRRPRGSVAQFEALFLRGGMLVRLGEAEAVQQAAAEIEAAARPGLTPAGLAQALALALRAQWEARNGSQGLAQLKLQQALAMVAEGALSKRLRLQLHATEARIAENRGQLSAAVALGQRAVLLADRLGPDWRRSEHRIALAYTLLLARQHQAALGLAREAMELAQASGDLLAQADVNTTLGLLYGQLGQAEAELQALQSAIDLARRAQAPLVEVLGIANLADHYLKRGDYRTALTLSQQALPLARAARDPVTESVALTNAGLALISLGQREQGQALVKESLGIEERAGNLTAMAQIQHEAGHYLERAGFLPQAWAAFSEHRVLADKVFQRQHQQALLETQAAYQHERGQRAMALLASENQLKQAQLQAQALQQRMAAAGLLAGLGLLASLAWLLQRLRRENAALRASNLALHETSERDPLTGLANRHQLHRRLLRDEQALLRGPGALLLVDIDHFKQINDRHGHATGDAVLQAVAARLRNALRAEDLLVRWGGEEFLLLARTEAPGQGLALGERLVRLIAADAVSHGGHLVKVNISVGLVELDAAPADQALCPASAAGQAQAPASLQTWSLLLGLADRALFAAKHGGRNRACAASCSVPQEPAATQATAGHGAAPQARGPGSGASAASSLLRAALLLWLPLAGAALLGSASPPARAHMAAGVTGAQARAAALLDQGYDRPQGVLTQLQAWQRTTRPGSDDWQLLQTTRGLVLATAGRTQEALQLAEALQGQAEQDSAGAADASLVRAQALDQAGQASQALQAARDAQQAYHGACAEVPPQPGCNPRHIWRAQYLVARLNLSHGYSSLALEQAIAAAGFAARHQDPRGQALGLTMAARASLQLGQAEAAAEHFDKAMRLARQHDEPALLARMYWAKTVFDEMRGDMPASLRAAEEGLRWAERADSPRVRAMLQVNLSHNWLRKGQPRRALQAAEQALPVVRRHGDQRAERVLLVNAALARLALGHKAAASAMLQQLEQAYAASGATADQAELLREFSQAMADAGDMRAALDLYHRERELAAKLMAANRESALAELQQRYDLEAQERERLVLHQQNALLAEQLKLRKKQRQLWAAAGVALLLAGSAIALLMQRVRRARRLLEQSREHLHRQSLLDALTGAANRRALIQRVPQDCSGALILLDIDHFKRINDRFGHLAGDEVLVQLAARLQATLDKQDLLARWGGEEFVVHAGGADASGAAALVQGLLQAVAAAPFRLSDGQVLDVAVSAGWGHFPLPQAPGPMPLDRALGLVDMALYDAKRQGRGRAVSVSQALAERASDQTAPAALA